MNELLALTLSLRDIPLPFTGEGQQDQSMPYPHYMIGVARRLREKPAPAEELLWMPLRNRRLGGLKFVRQHPFNRYVVDFCCAELKLVIKIEGGCPSIA